MNQDELKKFLQNEPLMHAEPTLGMLDAGFLEKPQGSIYFGTGLTTPRAPSVGLPFDILIFLLTAEKLRRQFGMDKIYHHIADTHALTNAFCKREGIAQMAAEYKDVVSRIARLAKIPVVVQLSSEFDATESYDALLATVVTDKAEYVKRELADMLWYRKQHDVRLKLGWLVQASESELGFDERLYDREFRAVCDAHMSFAYTVSGRTMDLKRQKVSPYISIADEHRILLKPDEDVSAKVAMMTPEWNGDKTYGGLTNQLSATLRLWERLTETSVGRGQPVFERVQLLINLIFSDV